jgi:hypothetical protein
LAENCSKACGFKRSSHQNLKNDQGLNLEGNYISNGRYFCFYRFIYTRAFIGHDIFGTDYFCI